MLLAAKRLGFLQEGLGLLAKGRGNDKLVRRARSLVWPQTLTKDVMREIRSLDDAAVLYDHYGDEILMDGRDLLNGELFYYAAVAAPKLSLVTCK